MCGGADVRPRSAIGYVSLVALLVWLFLVALAHQWIPGLQHGWAFNLWQYLPAWLPPIFALLALAWCSAAVRRKGLAALERLVPRQGFLARPSLAGDAALCGLVTLGFWLLRERQDFGDSAILVWAAVRDWQFHFPDPGATFLIGAVLRLGRWLTGNMDGAILVLRVSVCLSGGLFFVLVQRAARHLSPGRALPAAALLLSGGMLRIFAGHAEVYAYLFIVLAALLWASLAYLDHRCGWLVPCAVLGAALWLHASALCLVPGVLVLRCSAHAERPAVLELVRGLALVLLPSVGFLLFWALAGEGDRLIASLQSLLQSLAPGAAGGELHRWIRLPGRGPGVGTDYVLLSLGHIKYLANAMHLLAPIVLPGLVAVAALRPSKPWGDARARFLMALCAPLALYTLALRPIWGPYDWDLFGITAFFGAALTVHLLNACFETESYEHIVSSVCVFALLFVTIPFLVAGVTTARPAGPFAHEHKDWQPRDPRAAPHPELAPWL